jgi:hypothetical protein
MGPLSNTPGEGTMNSLGTLNSVNLDRVNERNEQRMAKLGIDMNLT